MIKLLKAFKILSFFKKNKNHFNNVSIKPFYWYVVKTFRFRVSYNFLPVYDIIGILIYISSGQNNTSS